MSVKRQRLTREQSKEQTRQRLLDAAQALFMRRGFAAASVQAIAAAAGFTRGAFYSNFHSKPDLLLELLMREQQTVREDLGTVFEGVTSREEMEESMLRFYSKPGREKKCALLWIDAQLLAVRDDRFRLSFNAFSREQLKQLSACIDEFSTRTGTPLPLSADALAMGLISLRDGIRFFRMTNPLYATEEITQSVLSGFFARLVLD